MGRIGPIGMPEIILILVLVVLLFGGRRLPALAKGIAQAIREFRSTIKDGHEHDRPGHGAAQASQSAPTPTPTRAEASNVGADPTGASPHARRDDAG